MGISGSASFHRVKKSLQGAANARVRAKSASEPVEFCACKHSPALHRGGPALPSTVPHDAAMVEDLLKLRSFLNLSGRQIHLSANVSEIQAGHIGQENELAVLYER